MGRDGLDTPEPFILAYRVALMKLASPRDPGEGPTEATTTCTLAIPPLAAQVLTPLITRSSPASSQTARVRTAATSRPAPGSLEQNGPGFTSAPSPGSCGHHSPACPGVPFATTDMAARVDPASDRPIPAS
jgi:hypothetical protein